MTKISATQAAKLARVSTPTITRAIENGVISAEKKQKGGYLIDPSEIDRFIASRINKSKLNINTLQSETLKKPNELHQEIGSLRQQIDTLKSERERERNQLSNQIDDLRNRLDKSEDERRATQARLEDQRQKSLFGRIFGK